MMAMPRGLARDFIGGAKVGEHLIAGHGRSRSWASWKIPKTTSTAAQWL